MALRETGDEGRGTGERAGAEPRPYTFTKSASGGPM